MDISWRFSIVPPNSPSVVALAASIVVFTLLRASPSMFENERALSAEGAAVMEVEVIWVAMGLMPPVPVRP